MHGHPLGSLHGKGVHLIQGPLLTWKSALGCSQILLDYSRDAFSVNKRLALREVLKALEKPGVWRSPSVSCSPEHSISL